MGARACGWSLGNFQGDRQGLGETRLGAGWWVPNPRGSKALSSIRGLWVMPQPCRGLSYDMRGQQVQTVRTQALGRKFKERAKVRCNGQGVGPPWMAKTKWAVSRDQRPQSSPLLSTLIRSHLKHRGLQAERVSPCLQRDWSRASGHQNPHPAQCCPRRQGPQPFARQAPVAPTSHSPRILRSSVERQEVSLQVPLLPSEK